LGVTLKNDAACFFNFGTVNGYPCGGGFRFLERIIILRECLD